MKKICNIVLTLIVSLLVIGNFSFIYAASDCSINMSLASEAKEGDTVTMVLSISNVVSDDAGAIRAIKGKIEYDTSVFESLTIDEDGILKEAETVTGWEVPQYNTTTNEFVMTGVASSARDVMKINFKVKSGAKAGNTTISVKDVELSDGEKKLTKSVSKTLVINSSSSNNNNNSGNNNNNNNNNGNSSNNGNSNNNSKY